nr:MAG TPA: hypothetical protein [Caudoviricetes sp.]
MSVPYDKFTEAFLAKITEYDFVNMKDFERNNLIDGYMKRAIAAFRHINPYDLSSTADDNIREFNVDIPAEEIDELVDIISEGMLAQWMKPYTYKQENLEMALNTRDFTTYSPAELLNRISSAYAKVQKDFVSMMREYSYNHGDLTDLYL